MSHKSCPILFYENWEQRDAFNLGVKISMSYQNILSYYEYSDRGDRMCNRVDKLICNNHL